MQTRSKLVAGLLLAVFLLGLGFSPQSFAQCPETGSTDFFPYDAEEVQLVACSDEGLQGNNQAVTIEVPTGAGAGVGDLLVAVVQTDGGGEDLDDVPPDPEGPGHGFDIVAGILNIHQLVQQLVAAARSLYSTNRLPDCTTPMSYNYSTVSIR